MAWVRLPRMQIDVDPSALAREMRVDLHDATALIGACAAPSEAFWRLLELDAVRRHADLFLPPVMEVGCGDGVFTRLTGVHVEVGTDRQQRAVDRARSEGHYKHVFQLDVLELDPQDTGRFGTIYAN